jgi:hypothetical protein
LQITISFKTCTIWSSTVVYCTTPAYKQRAINTDQQQPEDKMDRTKRRPASYVCQLGFYMDNVLATQNLSASPWVYPTLFYVPDPAIDEFEESDKIKTYSQGIILVIRVCMVDLFWSSYFCWSYNSLLYLN